MSDQPKSMEKDLIWIIICRSSISLWSLNLLLCSHSHQVCERQPFQANNNGDVGQPSDAAELLNLEEAVEVPEVPG